MQARGTGPLILKSSDVRDVDMNLILFFHAQNYTRKRSPLPLEPWHGIMLAVSLQDHPQAIAPTSLGLPPHSIRC